MRLTVHSVSSSQWGNYKGTLIGVSHLDLINWTNRMKWWLWELTGSKRKYDDAVPLTPVPC
jgi:triacylglycerol lipase